MESIGLRNLYVDYLLSGSGSISATELSEVVDYQYSHDQISRMLYSGKLTDKALYRKGRRLMKAVEAKGKRCLIFDDSVLAKPHSKENGLVCWHYSHSDGRCIKGINFLTALWSDEERSVPLSMELVEKEQQWDEKNQQWQWQTIESKNEVFRSMVRRLCLNSRVADYVLSDSWYASKENMQCVHGECGVHFVMALKSNRLTQRLTKGEQSGAFKPLEELKLGKCAVKVYLKDVDFPVLLVKKVFKNEDGSSGTLYLATSDLQLSYEQIFTLYKRRWRVEEYHKSLKCNCSLGKCQASSHTAQRSHFYLAVFAFMLLEKAKAVEGKNHFALKKELNILTVKYGIKVVKKQLHTTLTELKNSKIAA